MAGPLRFTCLWCNWYCCIILGNCKTKDAALLSCFAKRQSPGQKMFSEVFQGCLSAFAYQWQQQITALQLMIYGFNDSCPIIIFSLIISTGPAELSAVMKMFTLQVVAGSLGVNLRWLLLSPRFSFWNTASKGTVIKAVWEAAWGKSKRGRESEREGERERERGRGERGERE